MTSFKKLDTRAIKAPVKSTSDTAYWRKLQFPVTIKEFTSIDSIDISPVDPHYIAVTSGPKVDVYHHQTAQVWRSLTRFKRLAYGARFRQDGQLLLAGTEDGPVKLFNHRQKVMLRMFKGHKGPTHKVDFVHGSSQIVSFSDDKNAILWDIADEKQVCTLSGHNDFIRAGMVSPVSEHIVFSGSYDHTVKLWDTRTATSVMSVDHGHPVESLVCFPSGGVFVSAGGNEVRVWDYIGGKLLAKLSQHHKTVTSLCFATNEKRLMSGSLDRHVKIYDVATYNVVHTLDFPAPVLSLAVAPKDTTVVVGMISNGSGLLSFQYRREGMAGKGKEKSRQVAQPKDGDIRAGVQYATESKRLVLSRYDNHFRKFRFSRALDTSLSAINCNRSPHIPVAVMRELIKRRGLRIALAGRDAQQLDSLVAFLAKNIHNPVFKPILMDVINNLLDVYEDSLYDDPELRKHFKTLQVAISTEMNLTREYASLMGILQLFRSASTVDRPASNSKMPTLQGTDEAPQAMSSVSPVKSVYGIILGIYSPLLHQEQQ